MKGGVGLKGGGRGDGRRGEFMGKLLLSFIPECGRWSVTTVALWG